MGFLSWLFGDKKQARRADGAPAQPDETSTVEEASDATDAGDAPAQSEESSAVDEASDATQEDEHLMISQYAAHYVYEGSEEHKAFYLRKLAELGFGEEDALKLFDFECDILKRFNKKYLLSPDYTKAWLFNLYTPFFKEYPQTKDDILKEHFLALSELSKVIDEAEWHYWYSHERNLTDEVWGEIYAWHLKGDGANFAIKYYATVAHDTGVSMDLLAEYSSHEGGHLDTYKWSQLD